MDPGERFLELLRKVSYKRGVEFHFDFDPLYAVYHFRITMNPECAYKRDGSTLPIIFNQKMVDWDVRNALENFPDFIRTVVTKMERHEVDEWLLFDNFRLFDPHEER